jgi:hypothetical protein
MRNLISRLMVAAALVAGSAAPAMACGGLFNSGCSPCGQAYVSPCAGAGYGYGYGGGHGYGYAGVASYERLPDPSRYFYANQGPTFSGPGNYAPVPTYQETALSGPRGYHRPNYGYYDGGPYGNAINHTSLAQPAYRGPAVYSYPPRMRASYRHGYRMAPRYGYAPRGYAPRYGYHAHRRHFAGPRMMYAPRHAYPHHHRRMY